VIDGNAVGVELIAEPRTGAAVKLSALRT